MPFPAMAFQAHRILSNLSASRPKAEIRKSFDRKVFPSLRFARRVGSMYGSSNFFGLCGLLQSVPDLKEGSRVGFFAYGSGAIGEFYSARVCSEANDAIARMAFDDVLDRRRSVSVAEYEMVEALREETIEKADYRPDYSILDNWYNTHYGGKGLLVLTGVRDFSRTYAWS
jgi:3-hydroxy-3-methylglutaryl CoA synthase